MTRTNLFLGVGVLALLTLLAYSHYSKPTINPAPTSATQQSTQANPATAQQGAGPRIPVNDRIQLLNYYEQAVVNGTDASERQKVLCAADKDCKRMSDDSQAAVSAFNKLQEDVIKREKLPAGTGFTVDAQKGVVNVVVPAPSSPAQSK